jgi:uncharacterized membrane protein YgdD (TMEM256/DUF423 family)
MNPVERFFFLLAGVNGFLGVALGAFGAHGLRSSLAHTADGSRRLEVWETASRYQLVHAVALALVAYLSTRSAAPFPSIAGYLFQAGIVIFSGSLYALAITGVRGLGTITPIGGLCLLGGWGVFVFAATKLP